MGGYLGRSKGKEPVQEPIPAQKSNPSQVHIPAQKSIPAQVQIPAQKSIPAQVPVPADVPVPAQVPVASLSLPAASYTIRCAIIGNQTVGKSSLIDRYVNGSFKFNNLPETETA